MRNGFWWLFALFVIGLIIAWFLQIFTNFLPNLAGAILLCLILAALLGVLLGWLFGRLFGGGGWKNRYTDLEARFSGQTSELDSLRADLNSRKSAFSDLESRFAGVKSDLNASRLGRDDLRLELARRTERIGDLEAQVLGLQADLDASRQGREDIRLELDARTLRIAELEGQLSALAEKDAELTKLRAQLTDFDKYKLRITELETQLAELRAKLEAAETSKNRELELRIGEIEGLRSSLVARDQRIGLLEAQSSDLDTERLAELEMELSGVRNTINDRDARILDLEAQLASLRASANKAGDVQAQLDALRSDLQERNARIVELEADLNASRQGREDLSSELSLRTSRIGELESKLSQGVIATHDNELARLRADLESRNVRIDKLEKDLANARAKTSSSQLDSELLSLRSGLSERDNRIASLESQLSSSFAAAAPSPAAEPSPPATPRRKRKPRKKKEVIGYRVTQSRVFRADVVPEGYDPVGVIEGIGNANQQKLWDAGIHTFKDLSETPEDRLKEIIGSDSAFYDEWIVEARRFTRGVYKLSQATTGATRRRADDLTRIEGVGPKMNEALLAAGIRSFEELEAATETQLRSAIEASGLKFVPSLVNWSKQAAYLVRGDEAGFKAYTDYLVAGRDEGKSDKA